MLSCKWDFSENKLQNKENPEKDKRHKKLQSLTEKDEENAKGKQQSDGHKKKRNFYGFFHSALTCPRNFTVSAFTFTSRKKSL